MAGHGHPADAADRVTGDVCERRLKRQVVAFSAIVYFQGNSASSDLLLANVEALSGDEGVDDCDIFTYVRDADVYKRQVPDCAFEQRMRISEPISVSRMQAVVYLSLIHI